MGAKLDRVIASLQHNLDRDHDRQLPILVTDYNNHFALKPDHLIPAADGNTPT